MQSLFPIHVHTKFSLFDGTIDMYKCVRKINGKQRALGITDHGTIGGWYELSEAVKGTDIKPMYGIEAYLKVGKKKYHQTILAKNQKGIRNIRKLFFETANKSGKAMFTLEQIRGLEDVIILSGCPASLFMATLATEGKEKAVEILKYIAGGNKFYIELMSDTDNGRIDECYEEALEIAKENGFPYLFTSDSHYLNKEDQIAHEVAMACKTKTRMTVTKKSDGGQRFAMGGTGYHVLDESEVDPKWLSKDSFDELYNDIDGSTNPFQPIEFIKFYDTDYPIAKEAEEFCKSRNLSLSPDGLLLLSHCKPFPKDKVYLDRLQKEITVIDSKDFSSYMLNIIQLKQWVKSHSPGRGSACGSLILFLSGITTVDPVFNDIPFERFLNPKRNESPDVDLDFPSKTQALKIIKEKIEGVTIFNLAVWAQYQSLARKMVNTYASNFDDPQKERFIDFIQGMKRLVTIHASGVGIVKTENIFDHLTLIKHGDTGACCLEGIALHDKIYLKYDILTVEVLHRLEPKHFTQEVSDVAAKVFDLGLEQSVFQVSSRGMKELIQKCKVRTLGGLADCIALYRPGPMELGSLDRYIANKSMGWAKTGNEVFDTVVESTCGVLIYQDQVLEMLRLSGFGEDAENIRKAISKKDISEEMVQNLKSKLGQSQVDDIIAFSKYGFNKSHAFAYAALCLATCNYSIEHNLDLAVQLAVKGKLTSRLVSKIKKVEVIRNASNKSSMRER